jgi:hypothetical protein
LQDQQGGKRQQGCIRPNRFEPTKPARLLSQAGFFVNPVYPVPVQCHFSLIFSRFAFRKSIVSIKKDSILSRIICTRPTAWKDFHGLKERNDPPPAQISPQAVASSAENRWSPLPISRSTENDQALPCFPPCIAVSLCPHGLKPIHRYPMDTFQIISEITDIETIAVETSIGEISRLRKQYGHGRWRKLKGVAMIRLRSGRVRKAELHWYEPHGIGRK